MEIGLAVGVVAPFGVYAVRIAVAGFASFEFTAAGFAPAGFASPVLAGAAFASIRAWTARLARFFADAFSVGVGQPLPRHFLNRSQERTFLARTKRDGDPCRACAAMSVATRIFALPLRKALSAFSRCAWERLP